MSNILQQIIWAIFGRGGSGGSGSASSGTLVPRPGGKPPILPGKAAKEFPR